MNFLPPERDQEMLALGKELEILGKEVNALRGVETLLLKVGEKKESLFIRQLSLYKYPYFQRYKQLIAENEEEAEGIRALFEFIEKKGGLTPELAVPILKAADKFLMEDCVDGCLLYILDNKEAFDLDSLRTYFAAHGRFGADFADAAFSEELPFLDSIAVERELQEAAFQNWSEKD